LWTLGSAIDWPDAGVFRKIRQFKACEASKENAPAYQGIVFTSR